MLRIGYVRLKDAGSAEDTAALKALGCQVVRAEETEGAWRRSVLLSILEFIGAGDELVVMRLDHLGEGSRAALEVLERLEARGAKLYVVEPDISTAGEGARALRAALQAVAAVEPVPPARRRRAAAARDIVELQRAGVGPVEIARRLGVSRMTVWRKLKAYESCQA